MCGNRFEVDIGAGNVAFADILAHADIAGLEHGFVERDHPADAAVAIEKNYAAILPLWSNKVSVSA